MNLKRKDDMSTHKSNRVRNWIRLLLLLQIVAMLLPAHAVAAADQQVVIPKESVDAMVFQALWREENGRRQTNTLFPEAAVYDEFVIQGANVPEVFKKFKKKYLETIGKDYDIRKTKSYDEIIFTMLDVASGMPELQPYVKGVWTVLANVDRLDSHSKDKTRRTYIYQSARRYGKREGLDERAPKAFQQVYKSAQTDPKVAAAFEAIYGEELGTIIKDFDAYDFISQHPDSPIPPAIVERMRSDGTISVSLNDLKEFSRAEFGKINDSIDDLQRTLLDIDAKQDVLIDYINNQEERERMQALAAAEAAEHQLKLEAIQSSLFIAYTLADVIDPEFAYQLSTVGNATLQVAESLRSWMNAVSGLGTLEKVGSLSTVVMTGNVLGAVMNVVSLFGESSPSPDQMILEEIGKLRQQVDQVRQEMHSRFDRIDEELNTIYATMQDRFDLIDIQLGKLNAQLDEVQKTLVALDLKLSRIERNNFEFLDALGRRPLLEAINGGLGYQERTGTPMPYQPEFVDFENVLHGWATIHSFDALAAGPIQRDYSDGQTLTELNAYPLDSNINYLNGWLTAHGLPPIADQRLASPRDWLFASRAYTQLALEWPEHMKQIDPQRQAALDEVGVELEAAMRNISSVETPTGTVGNRLLFTTVMTYYQDKLDGMDSGLQATESEFLNEVRANRLQRSDPFDLYGGVDQVVTFQAEGFKQMNYGDQGESLPLPSNVSARIATLNRYNLAEYFTLSNTVQNNVSIASFLLDRRPQPGCRPEPDVCPMTGDLRIWVNIRYGSVSIAALELAAGQVTLPVINGNVEEEMDYVVRNWGKLQTRFEAEAVEVEPPAELAQRRATLLNEITIQLEQRLASYQRELYGRILQGLSQGPLRPQATELAGSKALLDSFVTLGLSRAVADDELLHAMLYGNQQLLDDSQIIQSYSVSVTQPITGTGILVNPRSVIMQTADQRMVTFSDMINRYLNAIGANTHVEMPDYIADTRRELDLTMRITQMDAPPPTPLPPTPSPDTKPIFLPLIER
jgi:hypothetical protein